MVVMSDTTMNDLTNRNVILEEIRVDMDVSKRRSKKNRKTKKFLVFNEQDRIEYLTGFRKRKKERQQHAKDVKEKKMKEDMKALKQQRKELLMKSQSFTGRKKSKLPDLNSIEDAETSVVDLPSHTVTVTDISEIDLAGQSGLRLGVNKYEDNEEEGDDGSTHLSDEKLKKSLKKLKKRQGEIDSSKHPSKKSWFQKSHPKQYDKKSLKKRKEKFSYKKQKKKIKPRN